MTFSLNRSIEVLERTPHALAVMLDGISDEWILNNEGPDTWSPYEVIGHLIHGEKTDWIPRMEIILSEDPDKRFAPFDRFAMMGSTGKRSIRVLLDEFKALRKTNIDILRSRKLSDTDLMKTGIHPEFGKVTLRQLIATWVAHDLGHIVQTSRVMAKQYKTEVGPWIEYLRVLK